MNQTKPNKRLDPTRFVTLEEPLQFALYSALPRLLPLFPSTVSRRLVSSLFLIPFLNTASPTPTSTTKHAAAHNRLRLATSALESMRGALERGELLTPPVLSALHAAVIEVSHRTPSPLRVTSGDQVRIDAKATRLLALVASALALLPPLLLEGALHPDDRYTRCASARRLGEKEGAAESEEEMKETAKGIAVRCLLVESKVLPISTLQACRIWCLAQTTKRGSHSSSWLLSVRLLLPHGRNLTR